MKICRKIFTKRKQVFTLFNIGRDERRLNKDSKVTLDFPFVCRHLLVGVTRSSQVGCFFQ
jgi:hypothetical protein